MPTTKMPKRYARVEVEVGQQKDEKSQIITHNLESFEGLNVRFNITKRRGSTMNRAEIAICNLQTSTVEYLTTINALGGNQKERKVIRLFAGYEDNAGQIFEGDVIRALPSAPPDTWITAQCLSGYHNNMQLVTLDLKGGVSVKQVCTLVAKQLKLELNWLSKSQKKLDQFKYQGPMTKAIEELNQIGEIVAYQDDRFLVVEDEKMTAPAAGTWIKTFSLESGLIGLPEPDLFGVKFKVLLDPTLKCGQPVRLESKQIPAANGVYYIYSLTHRGELRAEPFYTELSCKNYDAKN